MEFDKETDRDKNRVPWQLGAWMVAGIAGCIFLAAHFMGVFFKNKCEKAFLPRDSVFTIQCDLIQKSRVLRKQERALLLAKVQSLQQNKAHHRLMFTSLYENYYAVVTMMPFLSGITVVLTFLIAQNGWQSSSLVLKTSFLTFSVFTALYGLFPLIYKQEDMAKQNLDTYLVYNGVQKKVADYASTAPMLYGNCLDFYEFVDQIDKEELDADHIYFGLEEKTIDKKLFDQVGK